VRDRLASTARQLIAVLGSSAPIVALTGALGGALFGCRSPEARGIDAPEVDAPEIDAPEVDAAIDGPPGVPDLQFVEADMRKYRVVPTVIPADHCAVQEQCVSGTGTRNLLRFATSTVNRGTGDLMLPRLPEPGMRDDTYDWSDCHKHHHLSGYVRYELVGRDDVILTGRKQAFCIADMKQIDPGVPTPRYGCTDQGLSRGWADIYGDDVDCQWLDVTGLASGVYTLRVTVNPEGLLPDSDLTNNVFTMSVSI
jgi:hypothetical protein